jgi:hypothetical protein
MYKNIKDCVVGRKYRFDEHHHAVHNTDVNLSYMTGKCVTNKKFKDGHHLVEIQLDVDIPEFQGEYENKAMFYFPDDHQYENIKLSEYEGI